MIGRMAGRVLNEPLAVGKLEHVSMLHVVRDLGLKVLSRNDGFPLPPHVACDLTDLDSALPGHWRHDSLDRGDRVVERVLLVAAVPFEGFDVFHVGRQVVDRGLRMVRVARCVRA